MQERERILELVKKGILTTEEALVLLENIAQKNDERQIKKVADEVKREKMENHTVVDTPKEETLEEIEKRLEEAIEKTNEASASLDVVNEKINQVTIELKPLKEKKQTYDTMAELGTLTESRREEEKALLQELKEKEAELTQLEEEKATLESVLKENQKHRFQAKKEQFTKKMELPEDWKDQTQDALNEVGSKVYEASSQLGGILKKTFASFADAVSESVDWKDINLKVPGLATTKFHHSFNYPEAKATLIDVKLANGDVTILPNDEDENIRVEADIKLYGKLEDKTPLEILLERSQIDVDDELISFQLPNKRIKGDLTFYLPRRTYDHVSLKLLNGDVIIKDFQTKDIYAKSTNGDLNFYQIEASMLELSTVNGDAEVEHSKLRDLAVDAIHGDVNVRQVTGNTVVASGVNGDIRLTLEGNDWKSIEASSVNGDLKIAIPSTLNLSGDFKSNLGSIKEKLSQIDIKEQRNKSLIFERSLDEKPLTFIKGSTSNGDIFLKDADFKG